MWGNVRECGSKCGSECECECVGNLRECEAVSVGVKERTRECEECYEECEGV